MPGGEEDGQPSVQELPGFVGEPQSLHPGLRAKYGGHARIDHVGAGHVPIQVVAHRIHSSDRASSDCGIVSPSTLAAGLAPLRVISTTTPSAAFCNGFGPEFDELGQSAESMVDLFEKRIAHVSSSVCLSVPQHSIDRSSYHVDHR